jgi:CubicO group peptidase (beta-lactamase class C family)
VQGDDVTAHRERERLAMELPAPAENQHPTVAEQLSLGFGTPLWKQPGTEMSYCTFGCELLAEIVRRVSGRPIADVASERIFQPLGMRDTSYGLPRAVRHRLARRYLEGAAISPTEYGAIFETGDFQDSPQRVYSTALDLSILGQMFLQRGSDGDVRVLSPASVAAMTRNQIPGVALSYPEGGFLPEATWGLGWEVQGEKRHRRGPSLCSAQTFAHVGAGGMYLWVDPVSEVVGVYFSLLRKGIPEGMRPDWRGDLFIDAFTAASNA